MPARDPADMDEVAAAFSRACQAAGVRHAFVGGFAVLAWGQPRTTSDIDVMVVLSRSLVEPLARALSVEGLDAEPRDLVAALADRSHVSVFTPDPALTVDVKLATRPEEVAEVAEAVTVPLPAGPVRVVRPEHCVAYKVLYGSEQDLQDARSIVARQGKRLDLGRLRETADRIGVRDEVEALLLEVEAASCE